MTIMTQTGKIAIGLSAFLASTLGCAEPPVSRESRPVTGPETPKVVAQKQARPAPGSALADQVVAGRPDVGKELFKKYECLNCHSIRGQGGTQGPDLAQVGVRRSAEWLTNFVYDPSELFPESPMPRPEWKSEQEVADVVAFLLSLRRDVPKEKILQAKASEIEKGEALVQAYDCRACHTIGEGGVSGYYPELTHVGRKIRPEWERRWLQDTQKVKPGTFMPTFGFSDPELDAIAAYLHSLK
jgi:sulfur oxidation c-type cytochrome SoxX